MDEPAAVKNLKSFRRKYPSLDVIPVSCLTEEGIPDLKREIYSECKKPFNVRILRLLNALILKIGRIFALFVCPNIGF